MATNTTTLIIVTALASLVMIGVSALVVSKSKPRSQRRRVEGATFRGQVEQDIRQVRDKERLASDLETKAHAAKVEIDIKTVRARNLQRQATVYRSDAVTSRDHLNNLRDQSDKLTASRNVPEMPRFEG